MTNDNIEDKIEMETVAWNVLTNMSDSKFTNSLKKGNNMKGILIKYNQADNSQEKSEFIHNFFIIYKEQVDGRSKYKKVDQFIDALNEHYLKPTPKPASLTPKKPTPKKPSPPKAKPAPKKTIMVRLREWFKK